MSQTAYYQGAEKPDFGIGWLDANGTVIDFSSGYTFTFTLSKDGTIVYTQTTGITGAATSPNVQVVFPAGWSDSITPDVYLVRLRARLTSGSKDRDWPPLDSDPVYLEIRAALA